MREIKFIPQRRCKSVVEAHLREHNLNQLRKGDKKLTASFVAIDDCNDSLNKKFSTILNRESDVSNKVKLLIDGAELERVIDVYSLVDPKNRKVPHDRAEITIDCYKDSSKGTHQSVLVAHVLAATNVKCQVSWVSGGFSHFYDFLASPLGYQIEGPDLDIIRFTLRICSKIDEL